MGPNTPVTAIQAMQERNDGYKLRIAEILVGMHQLFLRIT